MRKSERKKLQKEKTETIQHQHKRVSAGYIVTFGFPHPLHLNHKNDATQKAHDLTIRIDRGEVITREKKTEPIKVENDD